MALMEGMLTSMLLSVSRNVREVMSQLVLGTRLGKRVYPLRSLEFTNQASINLLIQRYRRMYAVGRFTSPPSPDKQLPSPRHPPHFLLRHLLYHHYALPRYAHVLPFATVL